MAGEVLVDDRKVDKPGTQVRGDVEIRLLRDPEPYVSRAGRKLVAALDHFVRRHPELEPDGHRCLDVGASTGGFTDCLLQRGARQVVALDVGHGQLDYSLRRDPRVVVMERVNARHLQPDDLEGTFELVTLDVAFISLVKVIPPLLVFLQEGAHLLPMIKPQFEAGRAQVGKGGIVRDDDVRRRVVAERVAEIAALAHDGLSPQPLGTFESPVHGREGNRETFALFRMQSGEVASRETESEP